MKSEWSEMTTYDWNARDILEPGSRLLARQAADGAMMTAIVSRHPTTQRWHASISLKGRHPTWEEMRDARYDLLPANVWVAMLLPPPEDYINIHEHCFHFYEIPVPEELR